MISGRVLLSLFVCSVLVGCGESATSNLSAPEPQLSEREKAEYDYAYVLGIQAAIYGWAPVMMDVARVLQTNVDAPIDNGQAPINELGPITRLWDYRDRSYATPNNLSLIHI